MRVNESSFYLKSKRHFPGRMNLPRFEVLIVIATIFCQNPVNSRPPQKHAHGGHTTPRAEPISGQKKDISSDEIANQQMKEDQAAMDPFINFQLNMFTNNPQWFIQPGRKCNWRVDDEDVYIEKTSPKQRLPTVDELRKEADRFCLGVKAPGDLFHGVFCNPDTRTCECSNDGTWDPVQKHCTVLPGGLCYDYGKIHAQCAKGSTCVNDECVCDKPGTCKEKVKIPDPGKRGDPRL